MMNHYWRLGRCSHSPGHSHQTSVMSVQIHRIFTALVSLIFHRCDSWTIVSLLTPTYPTYQMLNCIQFVVRFVEFSAFSNFQYVPEVFMVLSTRIVSFCSNLHQELDDNLRENLSIISTSAHLSSPGSWLYKFYRLRKPGSNFIFFSPCFHELAESSADFFAS